MFEQIGLDVVCGGIFVGALAMLIYLFLNNGKNTSRILSLFRPRNEPVPPNSPEKSQTEDTK